MRTRPKNLASVQSKLSVHVLVLLPLRASEPIRLIMEDAYSPLSDHPLCRSTGRTPKQAVLNQVAKESVREDERCPSERAPISSPMQCDARNSYVGCLSQPSE